MHVQQVEIVKFGDFRHARGQRQIVRRIFEQRIAGDFHFVIVNVGMGAAQPNGLGIRNEMNFVIAFRQLQPQLGRDDAAAAVSRIAGDADFHVRPFRLHATALHIRWPVRSPDSILAEEKKSDERPRPRR